MVSTTPHKVGYVVRYYLERTSESLFIRTADNGGFMYFTEILSSATVYTTSEEALEKISIAKKEEYCNWFGSSSKGYYYISKVFYENNLNKLFDTKIPIKLTKPDRFDFLKNI